MLKKLLFLSMVLGSFSFGIFEPIKGNWTNKQGQTIRFGNGNNCEWIFNQDGIKDTFRIKYHYEKTGKQTGILDLGPFPKGILKGKTLYGIVEWTNKRDAFKFDAQPGKKESVRPTTFDPTQMQVYTKAKK
jgi:hypothetical protein